MEVKPGETECEFCSDGVQEVWVLAGDGTRVLKLRNCLYCRGTGVMQVPQGD